MIQNEIKLMLFAIIFFSVHLILFTNKRDEIWMVPAKHYAKLGQFDLNVKT